MDGKLSGRLSSTRQLIGKLSVMPREGKGAVLVDRTFTENGIYQPSDEGADGFSSVTVDVDDGGYRRYLYYRLYITEFSRDNMDGQTFQNIASFQVIGNGGINIANHYGTAFTANTVASDSSAAYAFDNDPDTLWESDWKGAPNTTGWVQVQLDRPRAAVGFMLTTRPKQRDYPHEALIQGSLDGVTWDTLITINESTANRSGWQKGITRTFMLLSDETQ